MSKDRDPKVAATTEETEIIDQVHAFLIGQSWYTQNIILASGVSKEVPKESYITICIMETMVQYDPAFAVYEELADAMEVH